MTFTEIVAEAKATNGVNDPMNLWREHEADVAARVASNEHYAARREREFLVDERVAYVEYATFLVSIGEVPMPFQTDRQVA